MPDMSPAERALYEQLVGKLGRIEAGITFIAAMIEKGPEVEKIEEAFADERSQAVLISMLDSLDAATEGLAATTLVLMAFEAVVNKSALVLNAETGETVSTPHDTDGPPTISEQDAADLRSMFESTADEPRRTFTADTDGNVEEATDGEG